MERAFQLQTTGRPGLTMVVCSPVCAGFLKGLLTPLHTRPDVHIPEYNERYSDGWLVHMTCCRGCNFLRGSICGIQSWPSIQLNLFQNTEVHVNPPPLGKGQMQPLNRFWYPCTAVLSDTLNTSGSSIAKWTNAVNLSTYVWLRLSCADYVPLLL